MPTCRSVFLISSLSAVGTDAKSLKDTAKTEVLICQQNEVLSVADFFFFLAMAPELIIQILHPNPLPIPHSTPPTIPQKPLRLFSIPSHGLAALTQPLLSEGLITEASVIACGLSNKRSR